MINEIENTIITDKDGWIKINNPEQFNIFEEIKEALTVEKIVESFYPNLKNIK